VKVEIYIFDEMFGLAQGKITWLFRVLCSAVAKHFKNIFVDSEPIEDFWN